MFKLRFYKIVLVLLTSTICNLSWSAKEEYAHHPAPKDPVFVSSLIYDSLKKNLMKPPTPGSEKQKSDEQEIVNFQKNRSPADCMKAYNEVSVNLKSFYGQPNGPLDEKQVEKLNPFFQQVRNDADYFIQRMKKDFPRKRPFLYMKDVTPCVPKEVTGAYPSGHAMLAKLFALILSDLLPEQAQKLETRSQQIGMHRVLSAMHHPRDIESGRQLAEMVYKELKASKKYQEQWKLVSQKVPGTF